MQMKMIEELADLMIKKKIICVELDENGVKVKITIDPTLHEKEEVMNENLPRPAKPLDELTKSDEMDEYEKFLYQPDKKKEAKLRMEIDSL